MLVKSHRPVLLHSLLDNLHVIEKAFVSIPQHHTIPSSCCAEKCKKNYGITVCSRASQVNILARREVGFVEGAEEILGCHAYLQPLAPFPRRPCHVMKAFGEEALNPKL